MQNFTRDSIANLIVQNIARDLVLAIEEALIIGARRAYESSRNMQQGHFPSVLGQMRNFHMNETFSHALQVGNASPSPICGNTIVTGQTGIFTLARVNTHSIKWRNVRRSRKRQEMSLKNINIQKLVQPELFGMFLPPSEGFVLFVAEFAGSVHISPEMPISIKIAVPSWDMQTCLFEEPLSVFLKRYETQSQQIDKAKPRLKRNRRTGNDGMEK